MRPTVAAFPLVATLTLAACSAAGPRVAEVPADATTVATLRHASGPRPAADWIVDGELPADAHRSDGNRALLLEATLVDGVVTGVEPAPLELANLIVRIDARDAKQTVVALQNGVSQPLALQLYVSPDGERYRAIPGCAIAPGATAYERWPERAAWIAVAAVRGAAEGECH